MTLTPSTLEPVVSPALGRVFPAAQIAVRVDGEVVVSRAYGWLDPETQQRPTQPDTLFDLASVTKLFTVTALMTLVEEGRVGLDQPVCTVLSEFCGPRPVRPYEDPLKPGAFVSVDAAGDAPAIVDASRVIFRHLLTHTSGLPAWRPLYREGTPEAARRLALATYFSYPIGARTIYSDIGLILLGMSIEQLTGLALDQAVQQRVTKPLGLNKTRYLPIAQSQIANPKSQINIAPTELCAWRGRRIVGEVHDENAAGLGGIAGHAGLFSTADDVAAFGQSFLDAMKAAGSAGSVDEDLPRRHKDTKHVLDSLGRLGVSVVRNADRRLVLRSDTVAEMVRLQAEDGAAGMPVVRRGLGFALWCPDPEASGNPFDPAAFGHTGFTGTSLWIDPTRALVVACLTNRVYFGRDAGGILAFRVALHRAIVDALS